MLILNCLRFIFNLQGTYSHIESLCWLQQFPPNSNPLSSVGKHTVRFEAMGSCRIALAETSPKLPPTPQSVYSLRRQGSGVCHCASLTSLAGGERDPLVSEGCLLDVSGSFVVEPNERSQSLLHDVWAAAPSSQKMHEIEPNKLIFSMHYAIEHRPYNVPFLMD